MLTPPVRIDQQDVRPVGLYGTRTLVTITCPWCKEAHTYHWRAGDPDPGWKSPSCDEAGGQRLWVPSPSPPDREDLAQAITRARSALTSMTGPGGVAAEAGDGRDLARQLTAILLCADALTAAINRLMKETNER